MNSLNQNTSGMLQGMMGSVGLCVPTPSQTQPSILGQMDSVYQGACSIRNQVAVLNDLFGTSYPETASEKQKPYNFNSYLNEIHYQLTMIAGDLSGILKAAGR